MKNKAITIKHTLLRIAKQWRNSSADRSDRADQKLVEAAIWADSQVDLRTLGSVASAIHSFALEVSDLDKADLALRRAVDELDECLERCR